MKKPNISPAPWTQNVDTVWTSKSSHLIACHPLHNEQSRANAQAVAAIPDLLDALEKIQSELADIDLPFPDYAQRAMEKAGYTF